MTTAQAQLVACPLCAKCQTVQGRCALGGPFTGYVQADPHDPGPAPRYGPLITVPRLPFPDITGPST